MQVKSDGDVTTVLKDSDFPRCDICENPGKRGPRHPSHRSCEGLKATKPKKACRSNTRPATEYV
jgi:hypothetical protein